MRTFLYPRDYYGNPQLIVIVSLTLEEALKKLDTRMKMENDRAIDEHGKPLVKLVEIDTTQPNFQLLPMPYGNRDFR